MTELPPSWRKERFGDIFKVKYGKSIDKSLRMDLAKFPVVGSAGVMTYTTIPLTSEPTIVIGRKGNVGSVQIFKEGCYPIDTTYYMPTSSEFDIDFLTYLLTSLELVKLDSSTATPSLRREDLENVSLVIPPIDEQQKIVELLEDHLSRLDAALADVKQAKIKAAQFRRSLLQASFTGYFSNESFTFGSEIPPSWRKISLGNLLVPRKQKDIPSTFPNLPYIGMENVARDVGVINSFGSSADYRSAAPRVYEGDVLYGRLRPYLNKVVISPCEAFASGEFIVLPPNEKISGKFLQLRLLSQDFVEFAGTLDTGDRPRVSWEQISRFELALPTIDEQMKIISSVEDHLSRLDASVSMADAMEKQSNGLRRSLLQGAFTGQLTKEVVSV